MPPRHCHWLLILLASTSTNSAAAHHSFAGYYSPAEPEGVRTISGTVSEFRFTNPHGILVVAVSSETGDERWTVETLAPAMLSRSGWSKDSVQVGEQVTVRGFRARDGSKLLRMQSIMRADGSVVGQAGRGATAQ